MTRDSLFDFCPKIGLHKTVEQPHREICDFLEDLVAPLLEAPYRAEHQRRKLLMVPRGCGKTTIGSIALAIYVLRYNPNVRILLTTHTLDYTQEILSEIKERIGREEFVAQFGDWEKAATGDRTSAWRAGAITVAGRTHQYKEPSIVCAGVDKSKVGGHYDLIICDDLANENNVQSERGRAKTRRYVHNLNPILNPGGVQLVIGTRWHLNDIYHTLMDEDDILIRNNEPPQYQRLVRQIWNPDGTPYYPSEFPIDIIEKKQRELPAAQFAIWYLNEAMDDKARVFPRKHARFFEGNVYFDDEAGAMAEVIPLRHL